MVPYLSRRTAAAKLERELCDELALRAEGLSRSETADLDEWHCRTAEATAELSVMAGLSADQRVLDIGCGLGGTARHLAAAYGVAVVGIDANRLLVHAAQHLNRRAGLADRVRVECATAESAPFATATFDCAWIQHVLANVTDKARIFAALRRVIVPSGVLALHEIVALDGGPLRYPLPWADTSAHSFVPSAARLRVSIESAGFQLLQWRDTTSAAQPWCARLLARLEQPSRPRRPTPFDAEALRNFLAAIDAGRLGVAMAVFRNAQHGMHRFGAR